jgi:polyisoprenoid-binding protein YceI
VIERLLLAAGWLLAGHALAAPWQSLPQDSEIRFVAQLEGAEAEGVFRRFTVTLDPDALQTGLGKLTVRIEVASADMSSGELNEAIAEPDWFDFAGAPVAEYRSTEIEAAGQGWYRARGELRLKCTTRPVEVLFDWRRTDRHAYLRGTKQLRRGDFCIGSGDWAGDDSIGQAVRVEFDVTLAP